MSTGCAARSVVGKAILLTLGTLGFVFCLTMLYEAMRSVMAVGGACASGGAYQINTPCPKGVGWVIPVSIFGMLGSVALGFFGVFDTGGPKPYAFAWSALFLALGWNFLDYGFDAPGGGTSAGWLVCGFIFVLMGGAPLLFLLAPSGVRWAIWGSSARPRSRLDRRANHFAPGGSHDDDAGPAPAAGGVFIPRAGGGLFTATPDAAPAPAAAAATSVRTEQPKAAVPSDDVVARLERLADLHDRGVLDEDEYEKVKRSVLRDEGDG